MALMRKIFLPIGWVIFAGFVVKFAGVFHDPTVVLEASLGMTATRAGGEVYEGGFL